MFSKSPNTILKIPEIIQKITKKGIKIYSKIDLKSAFHQILVHPEHRHLLSFTVDGKRFHYKVLPLGMSWIPDYFQSLIQKELEKAGLTEFSINYIDDIIVFSENDKDHIEHVRKVMKVITDLGFKINFDKSQFFCDKIKILGHYVEAGAYTIDKTKIAQLLDSKRPVTLKSLQQLHGLVNYFRSFVPRFAHIMYPITSRMKYGYSRWTDDMEQALRDIVEILMSGVYLKPIDPPLQLHLRLLTNGYPMRVQWA